jgi:hypothetical protein
LSVEASPAASLSGAEFLPVPGSLNAASRQPYEHADANGDRQREKRLVSGLGRYPLHGVGSHLGAHPRGLVSDVCGLVGRKPLTAAEPIKHVAEYRSDRFRKLAPSGGCARGNTGAPGFSDCAKVLFDLPLHSP